MPLYAVPMTIPDPLRLAVWCCPRTVSTALMRAFENRGDTFVCDEPLYAHYLATTGKRHAFADEVVRSQPTDWREVTAWLTGPVPEGRRVFYQKHMGHHLLPNIGRDWLDTLTHVFLIRDPRELLPSLAAKLEDFELLDTGYPQQLELFERVARRSGSPPPVVDSGDLLRDPEGVLRALCEAVGLDFTERMLAWPPGPRPTDGVWARHWYGNVEGSTGFAPYRSQRAEPLTGPLAELEAHCRESYERLHALRLRALSA